MQKPAVSIVIPAKNEEKTLDAVLAALWVSLERFGAGEVILVDNGSSDATCQVALQRQCRVVADPCASIAGLRNLGAREARGTYLGFLDADCIVDPDWVSCCVRRLSEDRQIGVVGTRAVPDLSRATWVEEGWYRLASGAPRPDYPAWIGSSNMLLLKEVFEEVGGFPEGLHTAEDVEFCKKIAARYRILLEKRIDTIHLRESKTVLQMFRRETWRGRFSIRQLMVTSDKRSEVASIAVPLLINLLFLLALLGLWQGSLLAWSWVGIALLPLAMMFHKKAAVGNLREMGIVYAVSLVYLVSRACASVQEILSMTGSLFTAAGKKA